MGLQPKFMTYIVCIIVLTSALFAGHHIHKLDTILTRELEEKGQIIANSLTYNTKYGVMTQNTKILNKLLAWIIQEEDVGAAVIYDVDGVVLAKKSRFKQNIPILVIKK